MSLVSLLVLVIVIGLLLYVVQILPLQAPFKTIALVLVVLIFVFYLFSRSGLAV